MLFIPLRLCFALVIIRQASSGRLRAECAGLKARLGTLQKEIDRVKRENSRLSYQRDAYRLRNDALEQMSQSSGLSGSRPLTGAVPMPLTDNAEAIACEAAFYSASRPTEDSENAPPTVAVSSHMGKTY